MGFLDSLTGTQKMIGLAVVGGGGLLYVMSRGGGGGGSQDAIPITFKSDRDNPALANRVAGPRRVTLDAPGLENVFENWSKQMRGRERAPAPGGGNDRPSDSGGDRPGRGKGDRGATPSQQRNRLRSNQRDNFFAFRERLMGSFETNQARNRAQDLRIARNRASNSPEKNKQLDAQIQKARGAVKASQAARAKDRDARTKPPGKGG